MKKKFAKKRERAAMDEDDVNQNVVVKNSKKAFLKPQDWKYFNHEEKQERRKL